MIVAAALAVAACSTDAQVESTRSDRNEAAVDRSPDDDEAVAAGGDDGVAGDPMAPDPTGLPELGGIAEGTIVGTLDNGLRYFVRENRSPVGAPNCAS